MVEGFTGLSSRESVSLLSWTIPEASPQFGVAGDIATAGGGGSSS